MTVLAFLIIMVCAVAFLCFLVWLEENWEEMCKETVPGYKVPLMNQQHETVTVYQAPKRALDYNDHDLIELCIYVGIEEHDITRLEYSKLPKAERYKVIQTGYDIVYG